MPSGDVHIESFVGRNPAELASAMNTFFAATGRMIIFNLLGFEALDTNKIATRLFYQEGQAAPIGSGLIYRALGVGPGSAAEAQAQLDTYMTANPGDLLAFSEPIPENQQRGSSIRHLYVFVDNSATGVYAQGPDQVFIAAPVANLAAQASGDAQFYTADGGLSDVKQIKNASLTTAWQAGERNYVTYDIASGLLVGFPSCCGNTDATLQSLTSPQCVR